MSIEMGDLVRFTNEYFRLFRRYSKKKRSFFRKPNRIMKVIHIRSYCHFDRRTKRVIYSAQAVLDVCAEPLFDRDKPEPLSMRSDWLAVVKKGKKGPSGVLAVAGR